MNHSSPSRVTGRVADPVLGDGALLQRLGEEEEAVALRAIFRKQMSDTLGGSMIPRWRLLGRISLHRDRVDMGQMGLNCRK